MIDAFGNNLHSVVKKVNYMKVIILSFILLLSTGIYKAQNESFSYQLDFELMPLEETMGDSLYSTSCAVTFSDTLELAEIEVKIGSSAGQYDLDSLVLQCVHSPGMLIEKGYLEVELGSYLKMTYYSEVRLKYKDDTYSETLNLVHTH